MNTGDEVIYTIMVSGITDLVMRKSASDILAHNQIPIGLQNIHDREIRVPRLFTFWRGGGAEATWQNAIREAIEKIGLKVIIDVVPWSHAPGYPIDTMEETK